MNINRIVFTGDILRPFFINNQWDSATVKNIRWLEHLLSWQLTKATGLPQTSVAWKINGFDAPAIYRAFQLPMNYDSWASIFYLDKMPDDIEAQLIAPFKGSLVIGVELPDILQLALTRHNIPFIDIISHPVRFMEDLLFGFRTNEPRIHAHLSNHQIDLEDYCIPRANLLQAKVAWMPAMKIPPGTALITGQVATDKALICRHRKRFVNLGDYIDQLAEVCRNHPLVLFKPHPYQDINCPSRRALTSLGVVHEVKQNFYYLIAQDGLTDVYAINSGTVSEAHYFGRTGHAFGESLYQFGIMPPTSNAAGDAVPVGLAFLEPAFWANLLTPVMNVKQNLPNGPLARPSLLRRSLNADWDYSFIDAVVQRGIPVT